MITHFSVQFPRFRFLNRALARFLLIGFVGCFSLQSFAESVDELMARLGKEFGAIQTVQTRFVETKTIRILEQDLKLTGHLAIENPGRLAWRIEKPLACTLIIADGKVRQWDEDSQSVQSFSSKKNPIFSMVLDQMQHWFSGDFVSLLEEYDVVKKQDTPLLLVFTPHSSSLNAKVIRQVIVTIREDLRYVQSICIEDVSGDSTTISFLDTVLNETVPSDVWKVKRYVR